ncbi:MAG: hypothetical protein JWO11_1323 [Nocardioides sp.]|nr:hypothetical protein [Nocardioides sp.]
MRSRWAGLVTCALVATGVVATQPTAVAAGKPDLITSSVSAPARVRQGERLAIKANVRNGGTLKSRSSATVFYLSADRSAGKDRKLAPVWSTPALRPGKSAAATTKVPIPRSVRVGNYYVLACADGPRKVSESKEKNNCRTATGPVSVEAPASSHDLISEAVAAGALTEEQGLTYQVFSDFGDPRLPSRFRGTPNGLDEGALVEVAEGWAQLSAPTQETLRPFLIPPFYPGSHWSPTTGGRPEPLAAATPSLDAPWCSGSGDVNPLYETWDHVDTTGGEVRIWWLKSNTGDVTLAAHLQAELEGKVLPALTALMGRGPKSDGGGLCDGGSDALDIALVDASTAMTYADGSCGATGTSAHLLFPRSAAKTGWTGLDPYLAHEVMHAIQFAMPVAGSCATYSWLRELTAQWVQDYVTDPAYGIGVSPDDTEFVAAPIYLNHPEVSLDTVNPPAHHDYGDYLLAEWAARRSSPAVVRTMWDGASSMDPLHAVDAALPGGFEATWDEFALSNWNNGPVKDYRNWDGLTATPRLIGPEAIPPDVPRNPSIAVDHLAARYLLLDIDPKVKELEYTNDLVGDPHAKVRAVIEYSDGTHAIVNLSGQSKTTLCLDDGTKRATSVVLIYSNAHLSDQKTFNPTLLGKVICTCTISSQRPGVARAGGGVCEAPTSLTYTWSDNYANEDWDVTSGGTGTLRLNLVEDPESPGSYESGPGSTYSVSEQSHTEYAPAEGGGCPESGDTTNAGSGPLPNGNALGNLLDDPDQFWLVRFIALPTVFHSTGETCAGPSTPETWDTAASPPQCPIQEGFDGFYEFDPVRPGSKTYTFGCASDHQYTDGMGRVHHLTATVSGTLTLP